MARGPRLTGSVTSPNRAEDHLSAIDRGSGRTRLLVKLGFGAAIAGSFLYLFLRGTDFRELGRALASVSPVPFTLAVLIAVSGFWLRSQRWRCYLLPVKPVGARSSFEILMIAYMASNFVPGRIGDFLVRPGLMRRDEDIPMAATLATIAVERLFDLLAVLTCFGAYVALFAPASFAGDFDLADAKAFGWLMLLVTVGAVLFLIGLKLQRDRMLRLLASALRPLPSRLQTAVMLQAHSFANGLDLFDDLRNTLSSLVYTVFIWGTVLVSMWLVAVSLGLDRVRLVDALLLMGLAAVGVAIPTPGGVGSFHYMMFLGLSGLAAGPEETLQAAAILIWAMTFVPVTVLGLLALGTRGMQLGELSETAEAPAGPGSPS